MIYIFRFHDGSARGDAVDFLEELIDTAMDSKPMNFDIVLNGI